MSAHAPNFEEMPVTIATIVDQVSRMLSAETGLLLPRDRGGLIQPFGPTGFDPAGTGRSTPSLVLFTSGSTGTPKGVGLGLEALIASARETERLLAGPGRWHLCLPANHIAGFQVVFRSLLAGAPPSAARPGPFDPCAFAADMEALLGRAGTEPVYTSLVPTQLVRVLAEPRAASAASRCAAVLLGGAAVSPRLLERAQEAGVPIVRTYGMSETAGGCVYDGVPFPGVELTFDAAGHVVLAGPVLADGYLRVDGTGDAAGRSAGAVLTAVPNHPALRSRGGEGADALGTRMSSHGVEDPAVAGMQPGFYGEGPGRTLVTSDLGRWAGEPGADPVQDPVAEAADSAEGGPRRIEILGRADDIIITGGENVSPHEVEAHLLRIAEPLGYREVLVSSVPDEEWGQVLVALLVPTESARATEPDDSTSDSASCRVSASRSVSAAGTGMDLRVADGMTGGVLHGEGAGAELLGRLQEGLRERRLTSAQLPRAAHVVAEIPSRSIGKPDRGAARSLAMRLASHPPFPATFTETPAESPDDRPGREKR